MNEPQTIRALLESKTIAVIGISDDPAKPSNYVSAYMQSVGHKIIPINPSLEFVLGEKSYPSLSAIPIKPDLVNIFRLPKFIPAIVDEMIALNLPAIWIQQGIVNLEAAAMAEAHGIKVVMDRCIMVESRRAGIERITI
jgi:predicted CoA-binding protein